MRKLQIRTAFVLAFSVTSVRLSNQIAVHVPFFVPLSSFYLAVLRRCLSLLVLNRPLNKQTRTTARESLSFHLLFCYFSIITFFFWRRLFPFHIVVLILIDDPVALRAFTPPLFPPIFPFALSAFCLFSADIFLKIEICSFFHSPLLFFLFFFVSVSLVSFSFLFYTEVSFQDSE